MARIRRMNERYSTRKLGAFGSNLGAVVCFFEVLWTQVSPALPEDVQGFLLDEAGFALRALGRMPEAFGVLRASVEHAANRDDSKNAAISASNLSELELTMGAVAEAVVEAEQSVTYADRVGEDVEGRISARIRLADADLAAGRFDSANRIFSDLEADLAQAYPAYQWLPGNWGVRHDEARLTETERWAWLAMLGNCREKDPKGFCGVVRSVAKRASQRMESDIQSGQPLVDLALDHLMLGRAALYAAILERSGAQVFDPASASSLHNAGSESVAPTALQTARHELDAAVEGLRRAGTTHWIPAGLLTRAWLRFLMGARIGAESAQEDLDEAWEIAERGPMKLFMADIHLYRARLFGLPSADRQLPIEERAYPWNKKPDGSARGPRDDLAAAEKLINECGYHRRDEELADAKEAAKNW